MALQGTRRALLLFTVALWPTTCVAAEEPAPPPVLPCEGPSFPAELVSLSADGTIAFRVADDRGATRTVPAEDLVRWSNPAQPRPRPWVILRDGGRLVAAADWTGDATLGLDHESLTVETGLFGRLSVPRRQIEGVVFAERDPVARRWQLVDALANREESDDLVLATNGDRLAGVVTALSNKLVTLEVDAQEVTLPAARVAAVALGGRVVRAQPADGLRIAVGFDDGSLVYATRAEAASDHLELQLAGGLRLVGDSVDAIASLQTIGGRALYLSDVEPFDYRHIAYLDIPWPFQRDRNVLGERLQVGGRPYLKGLAMHSASRLTFRLDGTYRRFAAEVALDDAAGQAGSVVLRVYLARAGEWQEAYASDVVRGGDPRQSVSVELGDANALTLVVDFADRGDERDYVDWLDARLVR